MIQTWYNLTLSDIIIQVDHEGDDKRTCFRLEEHEVVLILEQDSVENHRYIKIYGAYIK